ncbi:MAG TPA: efflux RND transporter permease subunit, partial [Pirellulales bacterium]
MTQFFIDRPIFAWVVSIVITLVGAVAVLMLPVDQYPEITPPTVTVSAAYPGASAQVVADTVAAPIEQQVIGVEQMLYMSSQSTNDGNYVLTVTFEVGANLNMSQVLVQNRVALALPQLPPQVQLQGVNVKKKSPNILFTINLISPDGRYDDLFLSNYATIHLRDELLPLSGVGDVTYLGQRDYSMRMWLDPDKLAARNLTALDVVTAVQNQNVQVAAGNIGQQPVPAGQQFQYTLTALGRLTTIDEFRDIILKTGSGSDLFTGSTQGGNVVSSPSSQVVRIRDVARVELGAQNYDQYGRLDGQPSVGLAVFQLPGSNALNVADECKQKMAQLSKRFPPGLEYRIVYDTTPFIRQSVDEVFKALGDAVLLVALVVLFFLQDWKAMILPMIDVPVSLVGTFAVMAVMGFSLNNLTLFGLVLAIGIVVDDAIVVLENIERLIATGLDARSATIKAMQEVTGPIIAITLVLCAVFLPSVFMTGITGQFYRQFALTISVAMIISAVNAMTLTPSRAVSIFKTEQVGHGHEFKREALPWWSFAIAGGVALVLLKDHGILPGGAAPLADGAPPPSVADQALAWLVTFGYFAAGAVVGGAIGWFVIGRLNAVLSRFFGGFNRVFDRITAAYAWMIERMLRWAFVVLVLYAGLLALTVWQLRRAPTGFLPTQDQGYLLVSIQLPDSASVQRTRDVLSQVEQIGRGLPGVAHTVGIAGSSFLLNTNGSNLATMFLVLDPFDQRLEHEKYDAVIADKLQRACFEQVEDAIVSVFRAPPIRGLANAGGFKLQTGERGAVDLQELQAETDRLVQATNADPRFAGAFTLFRANTPQRFVNIDRTKCEALQVPMESVFSTLQVYMGGQFVNLFNLFGRTWQVQVEGDGQFRTSQDEIRLLQVRNKLGQMVPLGTLATVEDVGGPIMVMRYNTYISALV